MVRTLFFIVSTFFASIVNADSVGQIDDLQIEMGDGTQIPHTALIQCGGVLLFTLEDAAPMMMPNEEMSAFTTKLDAYHKKHQLTFEMSDYFSQASEKIFIANGQPPELANYQMSMSKFSAAQQYRDAYLGVLETTGHPWANDSPFRITYQAHMDVCAKIYTICKSQKSRCNEQIHR